MGLQEVFCGLGEIILILLYEAERLSFQSNLRNIFIALISWARAIRLHGLLIPVLR